MKSLLLLVVVGLQFCPHATSQTHSPLRLYGQGCGPQISGTFQPGRLSLSLSQSPSSSGGILVLGMSALAVPTPTPGCTLLVKPQVLLLITSDATGAWKSNFPPVPLLTVPVYAQALFIRGAPKVTWLASRGMKIGPQGTLQSAKEDFGSVAQRDADRDGSQWAKGNLMARTIGGSGMHGDFDARILATKTNLVDKAGRTIYEMDAGQTTIPAGRTVSGKAIQISNGRFEFMNFHLRKNEHLRFVGAMPPRIRSTGVIHIEGLISVSAPRVAVDPLGSAARLGQKGHAGGPGGSSGGRGGDVYSVTNAKIHGSPGGDLAYPQGHPYATLYKGTGGSGSTANPSSAAGIQYSFFSVICQQTASGGGGGGFFDPLGKNTGGAGGSSVTNSNAASSPPKPYDFGAPSKGGIAIPLQKLNIGIIQSSAGLFLIGGSGGGGAGTHPVGTINSSISYRHAGAGGGGGGGTLLLKAGDSLMLPQGGEIHADGADGLVTAYHRDFAPAPGGAGSGGSLLMQVGDSMTLLGTVSTLGGQTGKTDNSGRTGSGFTAVDALSGAGGAGYYRIEAPNLAKVSIKGTLLPPSITYNLAQFRKPDHDDASAAMSRFYDTGSQVSPAYEGYVIRARVGASQLTLSHDAKIGTKANNGPVILQVQGIRLDTKTRQPIPGSETPWITEDVSRLSDFFSQGYRFRLVFDHRSALGLPITVQSIEIQYVR